MRPFANFDTVQHEHAARTATVAPVTPSFRIMFMDYIFTCFAKKPVSCQQQAFVHVAGDIFDGLSLA